MIRYQVLRIYDGDTFLGKRAGSTQVIRLNWIDAPEIPKNNQFARDIVDERQWYWGDRATQEFEKFVNTAALPGYLWVNEYQRDKYDRILGDVFSDYRYLIKDNLQHHLLRLGLATDFFPRMDKIVQETRYERIALFCAFLRAEYWAKKKSRGVWGDPNFLRPYEYRQTW